MKMNLTRIGGAALAATISLFGASVFAEDVVTETTTAPAPVVTEHQRTTTTTTTAPVITERHELSHDEKERLEHRAEKDKELREKMHDANKEYREHVKDAVEDANDD